MKHFLCLWSTTLATAVAITDNASIIFGGTDKPAALGTMYSIGAIVKDSNAKITSDVTDLLERFGITENRIYIVSIKLNCHCLINVWIVFYSILV